MKQISYKEYRCTHCKKLLFKGFLVDSAVEIKCKGCGALVTIVEASKDAYFCAVKACPGRVQLNR
ncbi:Com family DNA-binding transcriptional regulator [Candidatus Uhrbacteria bacterium]|nr:Com family DNA-binding transcriptional regulator [Candidatus Uhrbacteria bacterium]